MSALESTSPRPSTSWWRGSAVALVLALFVPSTSLAQVTYSGAVRTATGTYLFTERTTSLFVVSAVDVESGALRVSASVPLIYQSTPWVTYAPVLVPSGGGQSASVGDQIRRVTGSGSGSGTGSGGSTATGPSTGPGAPGGRSIVIGPATAATVPAGFAVTLPVETATSQTGLGDPILRASYRITRAGASTVLRVSGAYKPALASVERGFSTGAADAAAGISAVHLRGAHQLSAVAEYWRLGDMPDLPLNNAVSYRLGYDRYLRSNRWWVSGAVAGWSRVLDGVAPPADLSLGLGRYFAGSGRSLGATATFGLTDTAPDFSIALDWRLRL